MIIFQLKKVALHSRSISMSYGIAHRVICDACIHHMVCHHRYGNIFYLSKYWELFDTILLVLRGKPLTLLHVFHHIAALLICWYAVHDAMVRYIAANFLYRPITHSERCLQYCNNRVWDGLPSSTIRLYTY